MSLATPVAEHPVLLALPACWALRLEPLDAPRGRYFAALRARFPFRSVLGAAVLEEFGTLSSPVFLAPRALLGRVYDAGIALALRRDPELPIDAGWPPLVLGLRRAAPPLGEGWEETLLAALASSPPPSPLPLRRGEMEGDRLAAGLVGGEAGLLVTDAPLVPRQLRRLAETCPFPCALAVATGNRIVRRPDASPGRLRMASESRVEALVSAAGELW